MKIIKGLNTDSRNEINRIVTEMINIETGITYFDQHGQLLEHCKPSHNMYVIESVEYDIHPNIGIVILLQNQIKPISIHDIENAHIAKRSLLRHQKNMSLDLSIGQNPTTQYICVTELLTPNNENPSIQYHKNETTSVYNTQGNQNFSWYVYTQGSLKFSPFYIPYITSAGKPEHQLLSLSTIVYDNNNILLLDNMFRSPNVPSIKDYTIYLTNRIYDSSIYIDFMTGILSEIVSNFINITNAFNTISFDIFWIRWENVKPIKLKNCAMTWQDQVKQGVLEFYSEKDRLDDDTVYNEDYTCFMSGIPIYEDCYVFDIYEQTIQEIISIKDLQVALDNGAILHQPPVKPVKNIDITKSRAIKKGRTNMEQFVTISKIIKYDKPVHILISPYTMHCLDYINNGAQLFEQQTQTKIIVYRTFCPRLCKTVIDSLPKSKLYRDILHAFNHSIHVKYNNINMHNYFTTTYNNTVYNIVKYIEFSNIITTVNNGIYSVAKTL
jgi:hypothetical protein